MAKWEFRAICSILLVPIFIIMGYARLLQTALEVYFDIRAHRRVCVSVSLRLKWIVLAYADVV